MKEKIRGGYYLKARCIQNSEIAIMPPYIREIWDWLLKEANHTEKKTNGMIIKRGQLVRTFKDIQEGLKWKIGWRTMSYKKWQCENAMRLLKKATMITTTKTTRGLIITICNYDFYQNPINYDSNKRTYRITTDQKQTTDTINKNDKNDKNDKNVKKDILSGKKPDLITPIEYLNQKTQSHFDPKNRSNQDLVKARYNEGRTLEQFKQVIDKKVAEWLTDEKMAKYLRPSTLFNRTNFENYLNEPKPDPMQKYFKKE